MQGILILEKIAKFEEQAANSDPLRAQVYYDNIKLLDRDLRQLKEAVKEATFFDTTDGYDDVNEQKQVRGMFEEIIESTVPSGGPRSNRRTADCESVMTRTVIPAVLPHDSEGRDSSTSCR